MRGKEKITGEPAAPEDMGLLLKKVREELGISYEQAFHDTKISIGNLRAMEDNAYLKLPADTFTKGLLTLYAEYLGLDGQETAAKFLQQRNAEGKNPIQTPKETFRDSQTLAAKRLAEPNHIPSSTMAVIILSLIILSFTAFCLYTGWNPFTFITDKTGSFSSKVLETIQPSQAPEPEVVEADSLRLEATFKKDSTVEVTIDEQAPLQELYTKGTKATWIAKHEMLIIFPSPESAEIKLNGFPHIFPSEQDKAYPLHIQTFRPE